MRPWIVLALALAASPAHAQPTAEGDKQHQEGDYEGVKGNGPKPPVKHTKAGTLTWIGFSADGGTAHIFLQSEGAVGATQQVSKNVLVVTLTGVKRLGKQVRRPLETRYFDSPVARISVKKGKKHTYVVRIAFKGKAAATEGAMRTATEADGFFYTYLDLSGGASTAPD
jgi:hypothetical protein